MSQTVEESASQQPVSTTQNRLELSTAPRLTKSAPALLRPLTSCFVYVGRHRGNSRC